MEIFNGNGKRSLISSGLFKKCGILVLSLALIGCGSSSKEDKSSQATTSISKSEQTTQAESSIQKNRSEQDPLEIAKFYSNDLHWSEAEIYDYLKEHYTLKEANETLQALGADFKQNALEHAKKLAYEFKASKEGIRQDLEFAQFTPEEVQYAIDNLGDVDFKENALNWANSYADINTTALSKGYIYEALTDEDGLDLFTPEEAQYAIDHVEADFNQNALKQAKRLAEDGRSKESIYSTLTNEIDLFTPEEAQYAIDHLDN